MKNYIQMFIMVFVFNLCANNLLAQSTYVNINTGYGLNMSSQNLYYFDFYNYTNGSTYEQVNVSLGKGLNLGGALGYLFNENIGVELGLSYLLGSKSKAMDIHTDGSTEYTLSSKMLRINPSLVIASGFENINPYAKFGLIMGSGSILYEYIDNDEGDIEVMKMKLNGGIALGLSSGIGAMYNLSDKMSFFGELNMVNLSYAPTKGIVTEATSNGVDELPGMTTNEREFVFVDSYTDNNSPNSQPRKELKQKLPFGSFGVNIGLRINF